MAQSLRRHSLSGCCIFRVDTTSERLLKLCTPVPWLVSSTWGPDNKSNMGLTQPVFWVFQSRSFYNDLFTLENNFFQLLSPSLQSCISLPWNIFFCISTPLSSFTPFLLKCLISSLFSWLYCFTKAKDRCVSSSRLVTLLYLLVINYTPSHGKPIAGVKERI